MQEPKKKITAKVIGTGNLNGDFQEKQKNTHNVVKRNGVRKNKDGTESTHLMAREYIKGKGWVVFPALLQNKDGSWVDNTEGIKKEGFMKYYEEAKKRGEAYDFGDDEKAAIEFGDKGNWKKQ